MGVTYHVTYFPQEIKDRNFLFMFPFLGFVSVVVKTNERWL